MGLWIRWGKETGVLTMDWKKIADTEKGAAGEVEHKIHVVVLFTSRVLCIMNCFFRGKQ
jgi:hypothetical protein